jgi:hypothetical protein
MTVVTVVQQQPWFVSPLNGELLFCGHHAKEFVLEMLVGAVAFK